MSKGFSKDPYNTANWDKYFTTVNGGGNFLGVCPETECKSYQGERANSQQLKMQPFSLDLLNSADTYMWNIDQTTRRPMVSYETKNYGLDFNWDHTKNGLNNFAIYPPYVIPSDYYVENWDTVMKTPLTRNFHGTEDAGQWSQVNGLDGGLCYDSGSSEKSLITKGTILLPGRQYPDTWSRYSNTPSCEWIDFNTVFNCCTTSGFSKTNPSVCSSDPSGYSNSGSLPCQNIMVNMCEGQWDNDICKNYIESFAINPDVSKVVWTTVKNYINNRASSSGCGTNDYTSPSLDSNACRDDSKDPFIGKTLISLCSTIAPGLSNCDELLDQYCESFTRNDLEKDKTLQTICGCHLATDTPATDVGLKLSRRPQNNQYIYPGMTKTCDPICAYSGTIQTNAKPCSQTVCIMDKISIDEINSNCKDVTINQVCGQAKSGGKGVGNCYISNVDINLINSECGGVFLHQNCDACFTFDEGTDWSHGANGPTPANAKRVKCSDPNASISPGGGGSSPPLGQNPEGGIFSWIKNHPSVIVGFIVLCIFITFFILLLTVKN